MELKETIKKHLVDKNEKERLKRVETNSKLKKSTIYVNDSQHCKDIVKFLESEGVKHEIVKISSPTDKEMKKIITITNVATLPAILVNGNYIMSDRDFTDPKQALTAIQFYGSPDFKKEDIQQKTYEHIRTLNYVTQKRLFELEGALNPLIKTLQEILKEDETTE